MFILLYVIYIIQEININITSGSNKSVTFSNESTKSQWTDITKKKCCKNNNRINIYICNIPEKKIDTSKWNTYIDYHWVSPEWYSTTRCGLIHMEELFYNERTVHWSSIVIGVV